MKAILYLMTQKGFDSLQALIANDYAKNIAMVIVGRDKNIEKDFADDIIRLCKNNGIKFNERANETIDFMVLEDASYAIAISWRWLIPEEAKTKLIVLHDSLLPKYRGFAPLVNALIHQEKEIGVSAIFASKEYDRGDIIEQRSTKINYPIKIEEAIELISKNYVNLVLYLFEKINKEEVLEGVPQNEKEASYSLWRDEQDYQIDWTQEAEQILQFINAVGPPYKGAATFIDGKQKIRILETLLVEEVEIKNRDVGKVIFVKDKQPVIVCGKGLLKITKAIDDETQESVLPFKRFRIRLTS